MIRYFIKIIYLISLSNFIFSISFAINNKIVVKIDNNIVTSYEIKNKLLTSLILSNKELTQENININKKPALDYLINLKLKINELQRYNFETDDVNVKNQILALSSNNIEDFKIKFENNNIDYELFLDELKIETAWKQLMFKIYKEKVIVNQKDVDKQVSDYLKNNSDLVEYKISEIEIFIENNSEVKTNIEFVKQKIDEIGFESTAVKFSSSSTSVNKGNLGWIKKDTLNKNVDKLLAKLDIGDVTEPIITIDRVNFFKLTDKRTSKISDINTDDLRKNLVQKKKNELFNLYSKSHLSKVKNNTLIEYK